MARPKPRALLEIAYYEAAQAYLRSLPPEHFMEATAQATQREITLESLALVKARRPDIQVFNELLVQYPVRGRARLGQVVPDNMIVLHPEPIVADGSFDVPLQPARPFCVLEYVSKHNKRKDYDDNMHKYEQDLRVPYYLLFYPDTQDLSLYRLTTRRKYASVKPNGHERYAIPKLELEVGLREGWVRYWFRGELLPLPADLQRDLDETRRRLAEANRQLGETQTHLQEAQTHLQETQAHLEEERRARLAVEEELARLRTQLGQTPPHREEGA